MPSVTIRVTDEMRVSNWIEIQPGKVAASAKQRFTEMLNVPDLDPPKLHRPLASTNVNFWLNAAQAMRIEKLAARSEMSTGGAISNLLITQFLRWKESKNDPTPVKPSFECKNATSIALSQAMQGQGKSIRLEQIMLTTELDKFTRQDNTEPLILMAEADTGVGKTVSYLASAHEFLTSKPQAVVFVAVPSFALANQVL